MDVRDGALYPDLDAARKASVPEDKLVQISGHQKAIETLAAKAKAVKNEEALDSDGYAERYSSYRKSDRISRRKLEHRANKNRMARLSRRKNRRR